MPCPSDRRAAASPLGDSGFSLAEVLVALFILSGAVLGLAAGLASSVKSLNSAKLRQEAVSAASRSLEAARALEYSKLALPPTGLTPGQTYGGETIIQQADAALTATAPYAYTAGRLTVKTWVTWYDDPALTATTQDSRRVTAEVVYAGKTFRQSSLVSESTRGLPAPLFQVSPVDGAVIKPVSATTACLANTLTNSGARDTYELVLPSAPQFSEIKAYVDVNKNGLKDAADTLMLDASGNGPAFPDSAPIANTGTLSTLVCYTRPTPGTVLSSPNLTVRYRSGYDTAVFHDVKHTVTFDDHLDYYLRDTPDDVVRDKGGMFVLSTSSPTSVTMIDYDRDGKVGKLAQKKPATDLSYDFGFEVTMSEAVTLGAAASLEYFTASREGASGTVNTKRLSHTVTVQRVPMSGAAVTLGSVVVDYTHTVAGFVQQAPVIAVADTAFAAGDKLRISFHCRDKDSSNVNSEDCHFGYDSKGTAPGTTVATAAYLAKLRIGLR